MAPKPKDPLIQFAEALGPVLAIFTDYFRTLGNVSALIERILEAYKEKTGMTLDADDVKTLAIVLKNLSKQKK